MKTKIAALALFLALAFLPGQVSAQAGSKADSSNTGAVTNVKPREGDLTIADVLRRKGSGLEVSTNENGDISIRIRGAGTINNSGGPLVLIDGMRVTNLASELKHLDPQTIARVQVLRDVASTSMYGMDGANGVILITLKR